MITCANCKRPYPESGTPYKCPKCGGLFDWDAPLAFDPAQVDESQPGLWRYRHTFGLPPGLSPVSLGEGNTPLVWAEVRGRQAAFKCEFQNPTGSFKDRGTSLIVSWLRHHGVRRAVEDSSGNAGASFAAYAARAGMQAEIYTPASASGPKRSQIAAYGARLVPVEGSRADVTAAIRQVADGGLAYASHASLPFNLPGYATAAYEIVEQLGQFPGSLLVPAGQGGLLLGLARGFEAMLRAGLGQSMPKIIGVQARACAPLWTAANMGLAAMDFVTEGQTLAEGVRVRFPVRGDAILRALQACGGGLLAVDEADILPGRDELARRGLYVEPTSAIVWNALEQALPGLPDPLVVVLTGSGLKYQAPI